MNRADRDRYRSQYNRANTAAHRKAQAAGGVFLRPDEVADLHYHLHHDKAGSTGALARHVSRLLKQHGVEPVELRPAHPFERPLTIDEVDEHPSVRCARCNSPSVEIGGGYRSCPRCGTGFLMVTPDDVAVRGDQA